MILESAGEAAASQRPWVEACGEWGWPRAAGGCDNCHTLIGGNCSVL